MSEIIEIRKNSVFNSKLFLNSIEEEEFDVSTFLTARVCKCLEDLVPIIYEYDTESDVEIEFVSQDAAIIRVTAPLIETNQTGKLCSALGWARSFDIKWKSENEIVLEITI